LRKSASGDIFELIEFALGLSAVAPDGRRFQSSPIGNLTLRALARGNAKPGGIDGNLRREIPQRR
jgi:hypothetical protein